MIVLTAEPQVYINFDTARAARAVRRDAGRDRKLHAEGHFPPGSMGPKIEAVIHFLEEGGRRTLITDPDSLPRAMEGSAGTHFIGRL